MKKIKMMLIAAIAMLSVSAAQAQVKLGVKGGLNVMNMSMSSDVLNSDNQTGFFIGPTVKFTLPIVGLGIDASALYDQRKADIEGKEGNTVYSKSLTQKQFIVPINVRYGVGLGSLASIYAFAGPQFGFGIGDKHQSIYKDVSDWKLKDSNFSINVGLGAMLAKHLQISANYNIACGHTGEVTWTDAADQMLKKSKIKNNAWQIGLAYYF
jgi:opacity protein-like surface antigen